MLATVSNSFSTALLLLFLVLAVVTDLRAHRIPNWLSLFAIIAGLGLQVAFLGSKGFVSGLWGVLVAFLLLVPFYAARGMGAGDVKLMMGVGSFLGPWETAMAVGFTLLCGTVAGLSILVWRRGLGSWMGRYGLMSKTLLRTWKPVYIPPAENEVAARRFPYAAAIASGTIIALWWLLQLDPLFYAVQSLWMP